MKYKDSFLKFYILNPLSEFGKNFLYQLNMIRVDIFDLWYCVECKKWHSPRIMDYGNMFTSSYCIKGVGKDHNSNKLLKFLQVNNQCNLMKEGENR